MQTKQPFTEDKTHQRYALIGGKPVAMTILPNGARVLARPPPEPEQARETAGLFTPQT